MAVERCDFYSDEEYQQALYMEQQEYQREQEQDQYQELLNQLEYVGEALGIDHAISFLESLKNKVAEQKPNIDLKLPF